MTTHPQPPAQPSAADLKQRRSLDALLVERGLAPSRERAQALIAAGLVEVAGEKASSSAHRVGEGDEVRVLGRDHPWASRGGVKLAAALDAFGVNPAGRVCLDAGASTGGFSDVLLQRGATLLYAVDVDRTNLRLLRELPGPAPSLVSLDLSFISLRAVLPRVAALAAPGADVVCLFKPQFEVGREAVGKGGVVRDEAATDAAAQSLVQWASAELGAEVHGPVASPIAGAKGGNRELLLHLRLPGTPP